MGGVEQKGGESQLFSLHSSKTKKQNEGKTHKTKGFPKETMHRTSGSKGCRWGASAEHSSYGFSSSTGSLWYSAT